jgi:hypothetical protein
VTAYEAGYKHGHDDGRAGLLNVASARGTDADYGAGYRAGYRDGASR